MKIKVIFLSSFFLLRLANTYAMEEDPHENGKGLPTTAPKPMKEEESTETEKIVYEKTRLTFYPKTRNFKGPLLDQFEDMIAGNVAAYYAGRLHKVVDTKLPAVEAKLTALKSKFDSKKYEDFHSKKKEKTITEAELQEYQNLKKQEDAIIFQKAIIAKYECLSEQYL